MLLQTNSYIVPKEKRGEHARLVRRFRQTLLRLGCTHFEVFEQVGPNWSKSESTGRFVQILHFIDRKQQLAVQQAERSDPTAQAVIAEFCDLINFPYQQQQGLFAVGFYTGVLPAAPMLGSRGDLVPTVEHSVVDDPDAMDDDAMDQDDMDEDATDGDGQPDLTGNPDDSAISHEAVDGELVDPVSSISSDQVSATVPPDASSQSPALRIPTDIEDEEHLDDDEAPDVSHEFQKPTQTEKH